MTRTKALIAAAALSIAGVVGSSAHGAQDPCDPQTGMIYDAAKATARFELDVPSCPGGEDIGVLVVSASVRRGEAPAVKATVECSPLDLCVVEASVNHPSVEVGMPYAVVIKWATTGSRVLEGTDDIRTGCTSLIIRAGCPHPLR